MPTGRSGGSGLSGAAARRRAKERAHERDDPDDRLRMERGPLSEFVYLVSALTQTCAACAHVDGPCTCSTAL